MAKLKDLRKPEYVIDFVDLFANLDPSKTNKYVPFFLNLAKDYIKEIKREFVDDTFKGVSELIKDFEDLAERNQLEEKDIYAYPNYESIEMAVKDGKAKITESQVKKHETLILYEDENYLLVQPKSIRSSRLYGATTKWCTASERDDYIQYFIKYTKQGVLLYFINKKEDPQNYVYAKIAFHNDLKGGDNKITVWDVKDNKIENQDLFDVIGNYIPLEICKIIHKTLYGGEIIEIIN